MGGSWEQKSIKNRSKNGIQDVVHLGIDFSQIFADFGCHVGSKYPPKIALTGLAWRGEAGVLVRRDEAWRSVSWRVVASAVETGARRFWFI